MLSTSSASFANGNGEYISIVEDSNTKKVRFKDTDAALEDVMVVDPLPVSPLSWKDKLLGKDNLNQDHKNEVQLAADSFFLSNQDVKKSIVDGVPSIDFFDIVY